MEALIAGRSQPCDVLRLTHASGVLHYINILSVGFTADVATLRDYARARGWHRLRMLSCADNSFKYDLNSEDAEGVQDSTVSVFTLDPTGTPRHHYTAHPRMSDEIDQRGIDLLDPVWHLLDLTPQGRGDWFAALDYGE